MAAGDRGRVPGSFDSGPLEPAEREVATAQLIAVIAQATQLHYLLAAGKVMSRGMTLIELRQLRDHIEDAELALRPAREAAGS